MSTKDLLGDNAANGSEDEDEDEFQPDGSPAASAEEVEGDDLNDSSGVVYEASRQVLSSTRFVSTAIRHKQLSTNP